MNQEDKPINKLAKGSYFLILDNLANLGIGAIFWLVLAKLTDPAILGQAMVVWTLATTVLGFTGYGIQVSLSKYLSEYKAKNMPNTVRSVLRNGIKASVILSGVVGLVICLLSGQIATIGYKDASLSLLIVFTIATFLPTQTVIAALLGAFTGLHAMKYVAITDAIFQAAKLVFAIVAVLSGLSVFGILMGFTVASFIALAICYFYLLPRAIPKPAEIKEKSEGTKHITRFTSLNYLTVGLNMMSHHFGILILGTQSFEWAAFYGVVLLVSKIVGSFSQSVGSAFLPTASEQWIKGDKVQLRMLFNTAVRISILISGFGFIILMLDPSYLLSLISDSYTEAGWSLRILATAGVLAGISMISTSLLNAANRASDVARIGIIASISTVILTLTLASIYGIEGAAMAVVVGFATRIALSSIVLKQKEKMNISSRIIVKPVVAIMGGLMVGYVFVIWNQVLLGVLVGIGCYIIFAIIGKVTTKHEIKQIIHIAVSRNHRGDK